MPIPEKYVLTGASSPAVNHPLPSPDTHFVACEVYGNTLVAGLGRYFPERRNVTDIVSPPLLCSLGIPSFPGFGIAVDGFEIYPVGEKRNLRKLFRFYVPIESPASGYRESSAFQLLEVMHMRPGRRDALEKFQ